MSHADKALAAILEYDRLMSAINDCRKIISNPANECDRAVTVEEWTYIPDNKHSHIQGVLAGFIDSDGYAPVHHHFHRDEALEIIGDCEGCLKVFEAIQERKRLKAKLGSTKRTIRLIARNAMKGCAA